MNETAAVFARGLTRSFGERRAVHGLDLDLPLGQCLGLLGPNGAGKSTTVRMLSSLLSPSSGEVRVLGLDPVADRDRLRRRIGVVPQELALYEHLTGRENLAFFGRLSGLGGGELRAAVDRGLQLAGLTDRAGERVKKYSGGMKRRLNVAVALLHRPQLVFLDEPTVGIDPQSRNRIFEVVEELRREGTAMIYTSHQLGEVERLCDRILILDRGTPVAVGTLEELEYHPDVPRSGGLTLRFEGDEGARRALALCEREGLACKVEAERPGLEEVFLALTGRELRDGGDA